MRALLPAGGRVVGLAICDPSDPASFPEVPIYLATYEYGEPALEAAVRVLFGEAEARGRPPVAPPEDAA